MADEAAKSLRSLFLASLLIVLVWLISWPSAIMRFEHYRDARQLHAWLFLKERMANFDREIFDSEPEDLIDKDSRFVADTALKSIPSDSQVPYRHWSAFKRIRIQVT
ncbi:hypothetical protein D1AOALGA4SA_8500 [Olavius algarvensis Delta 1 endosymbiont]|nr:hypothetical protein D1AOALGA4SA_8500 [Olavius algarvensis Delta 1 endosymbiont]